MASFSVRAVLLTTLLLVIVTLPIRLLSSLYSDGSGGCEECQCARKSTTYEECSKTNTTCSRSFKNPFDLTGCVETGICTANSTDCGDTTYLDGNPVYGRCLYDMNVEDQETAYFSGHLCSTVKKSKWYLPFSMSLTYSSTQEALYLSRIFVPNQFCRLALHGPILRN